MTMITVLMMEVMALLAVEWPETNGATVGVPDLSYYRVVGNAGASQDSCYPRVSYAIKMADTSGQKRQISGVEMRGNLMEIYANPETGSWTLVLILPQGLACEIGHGTNLEIELAPH